MNWVGKAAHAANLGLFIVQAHTLIGLNKVTVPLVTSICVVPTNSTPRGTPVEIIKIMSVLILSPVKIKTISIYTNQIHTSSVFNIIIIFDSVVMQIYTYGIYKQQAISDWLNPHPLGTMSAFGYIENLA